MTARPPAVASMVAVEPSASVSEASVARSPTPAPVARSVRQPLAGAGSGVGVSVGTGVGVSVGCGLGVGVFVGRGVGVGVSAGCGVTPGAGVGVSVGCGAGVGVPAGAGVSLKATSCAVDDEALVVLEAREAGDERDAGVVRGVESEVVRVRRARAVHEVEVLAPAGREDDVHVVAVAQQVGDLGETEEDVALALDRVLQVAEVPAVPRRTRVRRRGDVADRERGRLVRGARREVDDAELLHLGVDVELRDDDALGPPDDPGDVRAAPRC